MTRDGVRHSVASRSGLPLGPRAWYFKAMKPRELVRVDPATLHLPGSRRDGADILKLHAQLTRFGLSIDRMPPPEVHRGTDGKLVLFDGVTRATRVAKYLPGTTIVVEVTGELRGPVGGLPTVGERL